jgi:transglutaminase-like putative cysteine protease
VSASVTPLGGRPRTARTPRTEPLLAPPLARLAAFAPLAAFGTLQWAGIVAPQAQGRLVLCALAAVVVGGALVVAGPVAAARGRAARIGLLAAAALALLVVALLAAGVPGRLLGPRAWDDLAGGIAQGLSAVPTARIPYRGAEEWVRIVLVLGGGVLVGLAALLAFRPVPRAGGWGLPGPLPAALALGGLYATAAVQVRAELPWVEGAGFAVLLCLFLWLERVERDALALAAALVAAAAIAALVVAPRVDADDPLVDYEAIAQSLSGGPSSSFSWTHEYGLLDWPRDGREVLRVRSRRGLYWKATNLADFDGVRWRTGTFRDPQAPDMHTFPRVPPGEFERIRVTIRSLTTREFIAAGTTFAVQESASRLPVPATPGTYRTRSRPLRRGHAYSALVYAPDAGERELRASTSYDFPSPASGLDLTRYLSMRLPAAVGGPAGPTALRFRPWGDSRPVESDDGRERADDGVELLERSAYARTWELSKRLRRGSRSPYDYIRRTIAHLGRSYGYSETPPARPVPLESFLFDDRLGYCQQFSGAMALLLRMGGVPARVVAGFSPGTFDRERGEFVVRDLDAHSWVEAYFPRIGWVTFDPTPASAPASGAASLNTRPVEARPEPAAPGASDRASDQGFGGAASGGGGDGGAPWLLLGGLGLATLGAGVAGGVAVRRRHGLARGGEAALDELRRALGRAGRPVPPQTTLEGVAATLRGSGGERYVKALLDARYGFGSAPTRRDRAELRRALGRGRGLGGRLRAWWALPPRP